MCRPNHSGPEQSHIHFLDVGMGGNVITLGLVGEAFLIPAVFRLVPFTCSGIVAKTQLGKQSLS